MPGRSHPTANYQVPPGQSRRIMTSLDISVIQSLAHGLGVSAFIGIVLTVLLLIKSLLSFTRTGPRMTGEVLSHYRLYLVYSLGRLGFYVFLITMVLLGATLSKLATGHYSALLALVVLDLSIAIALLGSLRQFWQQR